MNLLWLLYFDSHPYQLSKYPNRRCIWLVADNVQPTVVCLAPSYFQSKFVRWEVVDRTSTFWPYPWSWYCWPYRNVTVPSFNLRNPIVSAPSRLTVLEKVCRSGVMTCCMLTKGKKAAYKIIFRRSPVMDAHVFLINIATIPYYMTSWIYSLFIALCLSLKSYFFSLYNSNEPASLNVNVTAACDQIYADMQYTS